MALRIVSSFLARAMRATLGGLPAAIMRSYIAFNTAYCAKSQPNRNASNSPTLEADLVPPQGLPLTR